MSEPSVVDSPVAAPNYLDAFERQKIAIRALPNEGLETINVDPIFAIQATEKALPRLKLLRARLTKVFTDFHVTSLDNLRDYSHAYAHTTMLLRAAEPQAGGLDELVAECNEMLGKLEAYLRAAIEAGIMATSRMTELKGGTGYRNTVHDLLLIAQIYRANWSKIEGKTFLTQADIRRADELAARLNSAVAERESKPMGLDEVALDRQKAFTLFYRAYMRVRRAVEFLLKEDGQGHLLEEVMPSLHYNRPSKKRAGGTEPDTTAPVAPAGDPGDVDAAEPKPAPTGGKVGTPGSDPFTS